MGNNTQDLKKYNGEISITVHFLIILFGISAWIGINGIFIQTPVLINTSPEGWALPAYLVLVIQTANFGPLIYTILQYFQYKINEPWWILCLLVLGTSAMGLLSFFYSEKTVIAGDEYSLTLFVLTFFNALVGCFSPVLFMPYFRNFSKKSLVSYFIGEGLSGVLPNIVALIQGIKDSSVCSLSGNNTNPESLNSFGLQFSPSEYFLVIFVILFLSLTAFVILEYFSFVRSAMQIPESINTVFNERQTKIYQDGSTLQNVKNCPLERKSFFHENSQQLTRQARNYFFTVLAICCFFYYGFVPYVQSYSFLPYGNVAMTFAQFANLLACLLTFWLKVSNIKVINCISVICLATGSFIAYLALAPPSLLLQNTEFYIILMIISWTFFVGFISYIKLSIVSLIRSTELPKVLYNSGVIMQVGSASGTIFSFIMFNVTHYFEIRNNYNLMNT